MKLNLPVNYTILAMCLTAEKTIVLCHLPDANEYATWRVSPAGDCFWGHYHEFEQIARDDFMQRSTP